MPTPSPAIPTFHSDVMVDQTVLNGVGSNLTNLYNYTMGGFRTLKPFTAVRATTGQSIPDNSDTKVTWDTADINNDSAWASGTNDRLIVQTAGVYWIQLQLAIVATPGGCHMAAYICVNGTSTSSNAVGAVDVNNANMLSVVTLVGLSASATIYGFVYKSETSTSSPTNLTVANGGCKLTAEWISP